MDQLRKLEDVPMPTGSGTVIDLTLLLAEELPCTWSPHMPFQQKTYNYFQTQESNQSFLYNRCGPYQTRFLVIDEHTGTHIDAPAHFIPEEGTGIPNEGPEGVTTVDRVPLSQTMGPAVVVDVPQDLPGAAPGVSAYIGPDIIEAHEAKHGEIQAGSIVLLRSGWDRHYKTGVEGNPYCFDPLVTGEGEGWPAPDPKCIELLLERGVRCIGTDSCSMGSTHDGAPTHVAALKTGMVFIEALCNLGALPNTGAWFCFAPLNLKRGTGSPGRAFAVVHE